MEELPLLLPKEQQRLQTGPIVALPSSTPLPALLQVAHRPVWLHPVLKVEALIFQRRPMVMSKYNLLILDITKLTILS